MTWSSSTRKEDLPPGWGKIRQAVLRRDGRKCLIREPGCTRFATEVDHINLPSDHSEENLRSACRSCHGKRSARQGHQALARKRALRKRPKERHPGLLSKGVKLAPRVGA